MSKPILEESFHSFNDNTAYDHMFRDIFVKIMMKM